MSERLTVEQQSYRLPLRIANAALGVGELLGLRLTHVGVHDFMDDARAATGLDDFGDRGFVEGMHQLVDNVGTADMPPLARAILRGTFVQGLKNRLRHQAYLNANPHVEQLRVNRPIFVLGFPRTGTTLLQNLLALHPDRRGLKFWELYSPAPVHDDPVRDERIRKRIARRTLQLAHWVAPEQREVHDIRYDSLEECWYLFWNSMQVLNWDIQTGLHTYGEWLLDHDLTGAYREYRAHLQVLLAREEATHLVLKCPEHLWFIDDLLSVFPDACIIWTHRDPVASIASYCSMMSLTRRLIYGRFVPTEMGPYITERFWEGVSRAMDARDRWGDERTFFDVDFDALVADPVGVLRAACSHFDLPQLADDERRVQAWQDNDREDKRGRHRYSAEAFAVDPDHVAERYAPYVERFGITLHHD